MAEYQSILEVCTVKGLFVNLYGIWETEEDFAAYEEPKGYNVELYPDNELVGRLLNETPLKHKPSVSDCEDLVNQFALKWWSSLSINEQKEYSKKHLLSFQYAYIWDYSLSKHISKQTYIGLRVTIWVEENKPINF